MSTRPDVPVVARDPPYAVGYHTGVLRVDGHVPAAQRFRWAPWGVDREAAIDDLVVRSTVSMGYETTRVLWRIVVSNASDRSRQVDVAQDLLAAVAHSRSIGVGRMARPGAAATTRLPCDGAGPRRKRSRRSRARLNCSRMVRDHSAWGALGCPGIQRDEDATRCSSSRPCRITRRPMLPAIGCLQSSVRSPRSHWSRRAANGPPCAGPGFSPAMTPNGGLPPVVIEAGTRLDVDVVLADAAQTGVILTHGNHADSLQSVSAPVAPG